MLVVGRKVSSTTLFAMADTKGINLLNNKQDALINQVLNWSLSIGRLLIILVQTAALSTFLYRFSLDMQIVDLHDQIKARSAIVKQFNISGQEDLYRNFHDKLTLAKSYDAMSTTAPKIFTDIANMGKNKVTFTSLLVATDNIKIEAQAQSASALSQFVSELKQYSLISAVSVNNIKNSATNSTITIDITAALKGAKPTLGVQQQTNQDTQSTLN